MAKRKKGLGKPDYMVVESYENYKFRNFRKWLIPILITVVGFIFQQWIFLAIGLIWLFLVIYFKNKNK